MSESKELVLVQLPAPADLEAAFISDEYISNLIADTALRPGSGCCAWMQQSVKLNEPE
ncbi:hypothetical protein OK36_004505 [Salmonella enterica subsp. enterica]|uniref:hypothetical protein n=1 Tax=Salmonella enterica TaxID=28901 RepID=UPI001387E7D8|nr:hypothetical protein [Salmonella enterica]EDQ2433510.1 hypothetical protein [Salmonella enterica subsp. enterica]EEJ7600207.1 hypothetical protein [Salmonella enterica subsp. enterica serovar Kiambu]EIT8884227.1 hypothetical protein [Salmonella enterica subsp. enterica serovar Tananarive]EDN6324706.1 hypothetical protein [Salmonella enterica]EDQ9564210.1 hypothetical protein [Salmonella enterica subsp. enterica]